ncbi:hypothetical protein ACFSO7_23470 [Bacillus sp. CGMCC 1.16607]|uniref:hypothetical protein n=1 Tax=Bacillus sp. CGMCC 1.16607 TaxID=3351842 RepID=UPI0036331C56
MNKLLPQHFDENEWFLIISLCIVFLFVLFLPRRFPTTLSITFFFIGIGIAMFSDFLLGIPPVNFYDINDSSNYEIFELITFILYSPFAYLFIYFFEKWEVKGLYISLYILVWSIIGTLYEALAVYFHVYKYHGWNFGYSFLFYLASQLITLLIYYFIKKNYLSAHNGKMSDRYIE